MSKLIELCDEILEQSLEYEPERLFLTGGIGDFLAVECFLTDEERGQISTVINGSCSADVVSYLLKSLPNYSIKNELFFWHNLEHNRCLGINTKLRGRTIDGIMNFNFWRIAGQVRRKKRKYGYSSFLKYDLCGLDKFSLPREYVVIHPSTNSESKNHPRNYTTADWRATMYYLKKLGLPGVVLGTRELDFKHSNLIDLNNKTKITEAIEVLKGAKGFIGVDSFLSILASKLFEDIIFVKSVVGHVFSERKVYFATSKSLDKEFLTRSIASRLLQLPML